MPKLYSARLILKTLGQAGFIVISQKGSHIKLQKRTGGQLLTVIIPNHKEVATGTFSSILRQAQITKKDFELLIK